MSTKLTQGRLKEVLHYDPDTGIFTWLDGYQPPRSATGSKAGGLNRAGYTRIGVDGTRYLAHRLAVLYMTGRLPTLEVDHINGVRDDNRWSNLRECTHAQNHQNRGRPAPSERAAERASGRIGVTWHKLRQKWRASVSVAGKQVHAGLFDTPEEAHQAYLAAKAKYHTFQPVPRDA